MKAHSDRLRQRWADPVYREKQTEANRRTNAERRVFFADPLNRERHGRAVKIGHRVRKQDRR